jgi:hypothetical protein
MNQITGKLKRIGQSITNLRRNETEISILEIGDQAFRGLKIDIGLEGILPDGLNSNETTKLWLARGKIMAVQVGTNTRYFAAPPRGWWVITLFGMLITAPQFAISWWWGCLSLALPIWNFFSIKKYFDAASEGGQKV